MSWYRTYRSQTVADLDITPVREAFSKILGSGEFSHAYLLAGPKGTGKTSAARILAKVLNCVENRQSVEGTLTKGLGIRGLGRDKKLTPKPQSPISLSEPCNICTSCVAITNGSSMSVTEMDAASNRGIDDIRELRERIGLSPPDGIVSVFIIDEVHMLTAEAFNALLKVLEEPPAHVVFILATTDAQKMPATVVSRCTLIQYRKATAGELKTRLEKIAAAEQIDAADAALELIATVADGSFRDGVKLFEQLASGVKTLTVEQVTSALGGNTSRLAADILTALLKKDVTTTIDIFSKITTQGLDGVTFQKEVLTLAHTTLVGFAKANDKRMGVLVDLMRHIAVPIEPTLPMPWMPFEIACVEFSMQTTAHSGQQTEHSKDRHSRGGNDSSLHRETSVKPEDSGSPISTAARRFEDDKEKATPVQKPEEEIAAEPVPAAEPEEVPESEPTRLVEAGDITFEKVQEQWPMVLAGIRKKSVPMEGLIRAIRLAGINGSTIILDASYQFHKEQMELSRNMIILEEIFENVFGAKLHYKVNLGRAAVRVIGSPHRNVTGTVEDEKLVKAAEEAFL